MLFSRKAEIRRGAVNFKTSDNFLPYFASITIITTIFVIFQGVSAKCRFKRHQLKSEIQHNNKIVGGLPETETIEVSVQPTSTFSFLLAF